MNSGAWPIINPRKEICQAMGRTRDLLFSISTRSRLGQGGLAMA